jgi:hypothetical protein
MITVTMHGRLGNHLWQYAVCRTIAEKKGYEFSIPRNFDNIFDCDLGVEEKDIKNHFLYENCFDFVQRYDPNIFNIEDNTKLWGFFQTEKYILDNRENILKWFTLELTSEIELTENTCIINYRGGDYTSIPGVFLDKSYYLNSIEVMKNINPLMEFIVITDDVQNAENIFPDLKIYHKGIKEDFYLVSKAKYLIIANSTFSWWASWLNENAKLIIAPKYWLRPNIKKQENEWGNNWWSPSDSLTTRFNYLDRSGNILNYDQCLSEITEYNYLDHYKKIDYV